MDDYDVIPPSGSKLKKLHPGESIRFKKNGPTPCSIAIEHEDGTHISCIVTQMAPVDIVAGKGCLTISINEVDQQNAFQPFEVIDDGKE